ncbi:MAG: DNA cytosine methyltransferase [Candidatus Pacearchaeota archaeon]|jgi:site-specific DNA-cytosine methylase|nr:DNA cytosine methyltransferase [Clostridia bacterium]
MSKEQKIVKTKKRIPVVECDCNQTEIEEIVALPKVMIQGSKIPNSGTYVAPENKYPYTLKEFENGPVLKNDGKPFKWGTIIPLIGGMSMGCALATQKKPDFMVTFSGFMGNEKSLVDYWPDVPYHNLDEYDIPMFANTESAEEKKSLSLLAEAFKDVDFMNAVPPCAGLSSLNASKGRSEMSRGSDAIQNQWMYKSARFVLEHVKPKVLWGENAPALFTKTGVGVATKLAEIAKEFGYSFSLMKTNSLLHGVPQKRERTFYFFWNSETAPIMNFMSRDEAFLPDFLAQIPEGVYQHDGEEWTTPVYPSYDWVLKQNNKTHAEWVAEHDHTTLHNHLAWTGKIDEAIEVIRKDYADAEAAEWEIKNLVHVKNKLAKKMGWWDNSPHFFHGHFNAVVGRNMYRGMHPTKMRFLTLRELIWLMGHPHDFNMWENEKGNAATQQISQNVPVVTASHFAMEVMKFINGELPFSNEKDFRQNNKHQNRATVNDKAKKLF